MGLVKKILARKKIDPVSTLYSDHFTLELSENIHFHFRNTRMELSGSEFKNLWILMKKGYKKWRRMGKPDMSKNADQGELIFLEKLKINPIAGSDSSAMNGDELRIELIQWADYIHLHYKWFRIEFTYDEFLEFASAVTKSAEELQKGDWLSSAPRRTGKYHVACPRGRVDKPGDGEFWINSDDDIHLENRHTTIYFDKNDTQSMSGENKLLNDSDD